MIAYCLSIRPKSIIATLLLFISIKCLAQPVIYSISPRSGPVGSTVTITGSGFVNPDTLNIVMFGTAVARVIGGNTTSLTVIVPPGAESAPVTVSSNPYSVISTQVFTVTFPDGGGGLRKDFFAPKLDIPLGSNPYCVTTGDVDGDGKPDIIVAYSAGNTVSVFQNQSTPGHISFAPKVDFTTGYYPHHVLLVDLNKDGKPDMVVTNYADNTITILNNDCLNGIINFNSRQDIAVGSGPESVTASDLDGNGTIDLVVTNSGSSSISILLSPLSSPNSEVFSPKKDIFFGATPRGVAVADIDGDGKPDIAVTDIAGNSVDVFRNTSSAGSLSLATPQSFYSWASPQEISIADIDGDGKPELITGGSQTIALLRNQSSVGNVSFAAAANLGNIGVVFPKFADLDGDGKLDIAASFAAGNAAVAFRNISSPGTILFDGGQQYGVGASPTTLSIDDLDGDGKPDMVLNNSTAGSVSILRNKANEPSVYSYSAIGGCSPGGNSVMIYGAKFTGTSQLIVAGVNTPYTVVTDSVISLIAPGNTVTPIVVTNAYGTDTFNTPDPIISSFSPSKAGPGTRVNIKGKYFCTVKSVHFGNYPAAFTINSDSSITAMVDTGGTGAVSLYTSGSGTAILQGFTYLPPPVITGFSPTSGPVGTRLIINGKNFSPVASENIVYLGAVRAMVLSASSNAVTVMVPPGADFEPLSLTTTGTNLTGYSSKPFITTFGTGKAIDSNSFRIHQFVANTSRYPIDLGIADMDQDGLPEIISADFVGNAVTVAKNSSTQWLLSFGQTVSYPTFSGDVSAGTRSLALADFDGDGKKDIGASVEMDTVFAFFRNIGYPGNPSFARALTLSAGYESNPEKLATGDLDKDGKPDFVGAAVGTGQFNIYRNSSTGPGTISFDQPFPLAGYLPACVQLSDIDGDGLTDVIATNAQGFLYIFRNRSRPGVLSFAPVVSYPIDFDVYSLAVGDLDGDGKPEIVFCAKNKSYISYMKNLGSFANISFGPQVNIQLTGTFPSVDNVAIADMNGDGKPDICAGLEQNQQVLQNTSTAGVVSFAQPLAYNMPLAYAYNYLAAGDVNGDGKPDIVVISGDTNSVTVFLNTIDSAASPVITGFSPSTAGKGDTVSIKGLHLGQTTMVAFGGVPAVSFLVVSDSLIKAIVGQGASGAVMVTAASGSSSMKGFNYPLPVIYSFSPQQANTGMTITITGVNFSKVTSVSFGGTAAKSFNVVSDSLITAILGSGSTGSVSLISPSGNASAPGFVYTSTVYPFISSFSPLQGASGTIVTILGSHFIGATQVSFGGTPAARFMVLNDSTITAIVGQGSTGAIRVVTPAGEDSTFQQPFTYLSNLFPTITSFSPDSAFTGQTVYIRGSHLSGTFRVLFGRVPATSVSLLSDSVVSAVVGNGASGFVNLFNANGSDSLQGFVYLVARPPAPSISYFTPDSAAKGAVMTIHGMHLGSVTAVIFEGVPASSITIVSDSVINAVVGNGASGFVIVSGLNGSDSLGGFVYLPSQSPPKPVISYFAPDTAASGATVAIHGQYFSGVTSVKFGGVSARTFTVVADSLIDAVVDSGATGKVSITGSNGSDTLAGFVFIEPGPSPSISGFSPTKGTAGTTVTITGKGLTGVISVSFGGTPAASFRILSDSVILADVAGGASGAVSVTTASGTAMLNGFVYTEGLTVYPNPAQGYVVLNFPFSGSASQAALIDSWGRIVLVVTIPPNSTSVTISLYGVKAGVYVISWQNGNMTLKKEFLAN